MADQDDAIIKPVTETTVDENGDTVVTGYASDGTVPITGVSNEEPTPLPGLMNPFPDAV